FGFGRGVDEVRLCRLAQPPVGESHLQREAFADDLFLDELVRGVFPLHANDRKHERDHEFFLTLLTAPPKDLADVAFRQGILRELVQQPARRALLETAYTSLAAFQDVLCGSDHFSSKTVGVRRRIDILSALRRAVEDLLAATSSSRSGLSRIASWIETFQNTEVYQRLERLLEFEDGRSVLETRLQLGYDGGLRRFDVV